MKVTLVAVVKVALVPFVFAAFTSAWAKTPGLPPIPSSCGPKDAGFNVTLDKSQHSLAEPEAGKAQIYFIREGYTGGGGPIMFGIDGAWAGASHASSYVSSPSIQESVTYAWPHLTSTARPS
jgi:hypothetical protein